MRILIIQPWIRAGGAELLSVELAAALEGGGDEAAIATLFVDPRGLPASTTARRYVLPAPWLSRLFARSRSLAFALGPVVLVGLVLGAARRAEVLNPHNLPAPLIAAIVGPLLRRPVVWTCNEVPHALSPDEARRVRTPDAVIWRVGSLLSHLAARIPRDVLVLSDKTRRAVRDAYGRDAVVVRPGVDRLAFRAEHLGTRLPLNLLLVAKLHPQKDPLLAVRTLAAVRARGVDAALTIVGDGPLRGEVESAIIALGLAGHVRIERDLDVASLVDRYRRADVLLVTAGGHQSWGLTPFEAIAAGTPAVISAEAGAAEVLGPREAALVAPRDSESFADAVVRLYREAGLAERLVANGERVTRELTWSRYAAACRAVYTRALGADRTAA